MFYIGIDPGKKGAFAVIHKARILSAEPFDRPTAVRLFHSIARFPEPAVCCLEKVHAMPKQGAVSMFNFGENYGWWKGLLDACRISYQEIPPQTWKKEFGLNSEKEKSIDVCRQLFPEAELVPPNCRTAHDGLAEAILMAEYARRKMSAAHAEAFDEESWA